MNFQLLAEILGFGLNLLGTLRGDPVHSKLGNALTAVHEVALAIAEGSDINPAPVHAQMQQIVAAGRAPTPAELDQLHTVARQVLSGAVGQSPSALVQGSPVRPAARPARKSIQPAGSPAAAPRPPFQL